MPADLHGRLIDPVPQAPSGHAVYAGLLDDGVLAFQRCDACAAAVFPPRQRCHHCGADALTWRGSAGHGTIYATTAITPRGADPYCVVLVDVDEGYRMMSRIDAPGDDVGIGDRVEVRFERDGDATLPCFAPAAGGAR